MKTLSKTLFTVAAMCAACAVSAQDSKAAPAGQAAARVSRVDAQVPMSQMDEHMKRMQALHEEMACAATAEDRQRLMGDQRREMQQGVALMRETPDGSMAAGAGMDTTGHQGTPVDPQSQMQMMERRMDMMQTMMQAMMDRLDASSSGTVPAPTK